ncbi:MAG: PPK2 family polyphosphate kinase [Pseudomonadota bacterium]
MTEHRLKPGKSVVLSKLSTRGKDFHDDRDQAEQEFHTVCQSMSDWQERLYAEGRQKLLVIFQAMDAGGKDGTTRAVFGGLNPQGVDVTPFKQPSTHEQSYDFLWRVHRAVPAGGMIGIFNRSHYEDILVPQVEKLLPPKVIKARYEMINHFEHLLANTGTRIVKFFLHISKDEQKERLEERITRPDKNWKFSYDDVEKRKDWDQYMAAYESILEQCNSIEAPWHVIPADQKWYRNLTIARTIVDTLEDMAPDYPEGPDNIDKVVID